MIGRSLIVFQLGNNQNELHEVNSWGMALAPRDAEKQLIQERVTKKWKPEDVVSDAEVEAICNATNCIGPDKPGYHKWASDGVTVINISGDPALYNPLVPIKEREKAAAEKRAAAMKRLKEEFLPELAKLRNAVPVGKVEVDFTIPPVKVKVGYRVWQPIGSLAVLQDGKEVSYPSQLIDHDALAKVPEIAALVNCPLRKAYWDRCAEIANLLGLSETDVENETYFWKPS